MSLLINSTTLGNIIITLGSVFLLYYLIRKFAWDQITGIFVAREKKIATDIDSAENARQEAEILVQKRQEELAAARTEATQIIDEAKKT
ncbi:MAG: F0F1 ATP synthase subunit B, partial [Streptococcus thermophilus]|nr:F0F1 ATP synthase subunit B [Streptococcus thermophilus]